MRNPGAVEGLFEGFELGVRTSENGEAPPRQGGLYRLRIAAATPEASSVSDSYAVTVGVGLALGGVLEPLFFA